MPPDSVMILASCLSHSDSSRSTFSMCAGFGALAEQAAAEAHRRPHGLERVGGQLLRHQADLARAPRGSRARCRGRRRRRVPALGVTMPQMMLISVVLPAPFGPSSAKISPRWMLEVDALERDEAAGVGLAHGAHCHDRGGRTGGIGSQLLHGGLARVRLGTAILTACRRSCQAPRSSSSMLRGQSCFSRRDSARSASSRPPVWQRAQ